jgi:hypothetical protein
MNLAERRTALKHADLLTALCYDAETGAFTWLIEPNPSKQGRTRAGDTAGTVTSTGHVVIGLWGVHYLAHRLAVFYVTGKWPEKEIDHRNGQRADNRWLNLRPATKKQQRENATPQRRSASGVRGVYWFKRTQQWRAVINHNKKPISLGYHDCFLDAIAARKAAERRLFTHHRENV